MLRPCPDCGADFERRPYIVCCDGCRSRRRILSDSRRQRRRYSRLAERDQLRAALARVQQLVNQWDTEGMGKGDCTRRAILACRQQLKQAILPLPEPPKGE